MAERLEKMRDAEKDIYSQAVIEMRKIIEKEVKEIKRLSGITLSSSQEEELDRELGLSRTSPDTSPSPERERRRLPGEARRPERSRSGQDIGKRLPGSGSQERIVRMRARRKGSQGSLRNRRGSRDSSRESHHASNESLSNGLSTSRLGSRESSVDSFGWHTSSGEHSMDDIKGAIARDTSSDNLRGALNKQSSLDELKNKLAFLEDKPDLDATLKDLPSPNGSFRSSQSEETLQDISQSIMPQESFDLSDDLPANYGQMNIPPSDSRDSFVLDASEIAELVLDDKILSECSSIPPMDESRDDFMEQSGSDYSTKMTTSDLGSDMDSRKLSESECSATSDKEASCGPAIPERYLVGSPIGAKASDLLLSIAGSVE